MLIEASTLDDAMNCIFTELLDRPFEIEATRSKDLGASSEIVGVMIHLKKPRARMSLTETRGLSFSPVGELLWYLSGKNELSFIQYYIDKYKDESEDNETVYGGYGPRLLNFRGQHHQINNVISLLKKKPTTRQAVIQIFDASDIQVAHKEIPCTCTLQFLVRDNKLQMITSMRSNDAYQGLPHDIFAFTMLQEIVAKSLCVELGEYKHVVGSLHLYEKFKEKAQIYLREGFQSTNDDLAMPAMPNENPWDAINILLKLEYQIRTNETLKDVAVDKLNPYWSDIARLLLIHRLFKLRQYDDVKDIRSEMNSNFYDKFIEQRLSKANAGTA